MSKSIFHYTKKFEYLCDIIEKGFIPSFCEEMLCTKSHCIKFAIPSLCFCDIPITQAQEHKDKYGEFAIGVKKKWAIKNDINPITYLNSNSNIADATMAVVDYYKQSLCKLKGKKLSNANYNYLRTISHLKNYSGDLPKRKLKNINFYEEKEWRYVPTIADTQGNDCCLSFEENQLKRLKKEYPKKPHLPQCAIPLKVKNISHLIVPNQTEKYNFIKCLKANKRLTKNDKQFHILLTKIITYSEIQDDL